MKQFSNLDWSIVPGPIVLPSTIAPSDLLQSDMMSYSPSEVVAFLEGLSGLSIDCFGDGDWCEWKATYEGVHDLFELNMTLFDTEAPVWGGCDLIGATDATEVLDFWHKIAAGLPGIYLHSSEAELYSMDAFAEMFAQK